MPYAPARPCPRPMCPHLAPCPTHPSTPFATAKRSSHLYGSARWQAMRHARLLAEPYCRLCRADGRLSMASVVDHVKPHNGNVNAFWSNELQSLCSRCSNAKTAREARERRR